MIYVVRRGVDAQTKVLSWGMKRAKERLGDKETI